MVWGFSFIQPRLYQEKWIARPSDSLCLCTHAQGTSISGSFSAVSTPIFASKVSFFHIFRDLEDLYSPVGEKKTKSLCFPPKILLASQRRHWNLLFLFVQKSIKDISRKITPRCRSFLLKYASLHHSELQSDFTRWSQERPGWGISPVDSLNEQE